MRNRPLQDRASCEWQLGPAPQCSVTLCLLYPSIVFLRRCTFIMYQFFLLYFSYDFWSWLSLLLTILRTSTTLTKRLCTVRQRLLHNSHVCITWWSPRNSQGRVTFFKTVLLRVLLMSSPEKHEASGGRAANSWCPLAECHVPWSMSIFHSIFTHSVYLLVYLGLDVGRSV